MLSRETDGGAGPGDEADGRGTLGREDEADGADGRRGGREGDAGPGDEADGRRGGREARRAWAPGRETRRTGAPGREADGDGGPGTRRTGRRVGRQGRRGRRDSLPFRLISAVWVEIYTRRLWESLPFSRFFSLLGRDLRPAALGISTFFG